MKRIAQLFVVTLGLVFSLAVTSVNAQSANFNKQQRQEIEKIIHDYLVNKPEVLVEASEVLQQRQQSQAIDKARRAIVAEKDALFNNNSPMIGPKNAPVNLVEFFDYQCIHCKRMTPVIEELLKNNPDKVRVIFKEFPIFGQTSQLASKAALAANKQGKYLAFHNALMEQSGKLSEDIIMAQAKKVGLNIAQLKKDMESDAIKTELAQTYALTRALGIAGTPAFVVAENPVKDQKNVFFIPGAASATMLQSVIDKAA